ncbi:MAG: hypothetical protein Q8L11_01270 [Candidatus Moranbacteria bacterium]|nr:hypothetical protein [Candidatus Moranbacteria bacterium]
MGNEIVEKYFKHADFADQGKRALAEIIAKTGFQPEKEIFRGQIYDDDKVASLVYKGVWRDGPAVLKIQGLRPEIDEIRMIGAFNGQNGSSAIRLPEFYGGSKWDERAGYGYLLLEYIDAPRIYQTPFANRKQTDDFCAFYQEYKTKCLSEPFFSKEPNERSSLVFTAQRVSHWARIAQAKGHLTEGRVENVGRFLSLAGRHLPSIGMEFMHGHLTSEDIFKLPGNKYVLMSNLFWSYRPECYDMTFHLWYGLKSLRDQNMTAAQIKGYLQSWFEAYKKIPSIAQDTDFERKFDMAMAERCLGALLVDIRNQHYTDDREKYVGHLTRIFQELFGYFADKLEKM